MNEYVPQIDLNGKLLIEYQKPTPAHNVVVPLTRYGRRGAGIVLVGVKYARPRIGRNTMVQTPDGRLCKFKRTGEYREGRG